MPGPAAREHGPGTAAPPERPGGAFAREAFELDGPFQIGVARPRMFRRLRVEEDGAADRGEELRMDTMDPGAWK